MGRRPYPLRKFSPEPDFYLAMTGLSLFLIFDKYAPIT
jgi:hypothetical protein